MTVLVVEDDLEINELIGEYLTLENWKYLQATTGEAGIHLAQEQHPDAIILDLMLPDIDGFEVARTLARRATYDIPIVILSCMCQDVDRQKGYASGALFYMNKPFLPDDLIAKLREAFDWKASLKTRQPAGTLALGEKDPCVCPRAINQMVADLYARTDLADPAVTQIRQAVETLALWALKWNQEHKTQNQLLLDYKIAPAGNNGNGTAASIEWKLSEATPGLLTDAFFKPASAAQTVGGGGGGGLMGWGGGSVPHPNTAPLGPPATWLQVLAKTGAARFEKDSVARTVRFTRTAAGGGGSVNGLAPTGATVPVVEIDGTRYPTRSRDEALAAKRK